MMDKDIRKAQDLFYPELFFIEVVFIYFLFVMLNGSETFPVLSDSSYLRMIKRVKKITLHSMLSRQV